MKFVLDASLTLAWCFEDEKSGFTDSVLRALPLVGAAVPSIWAYEVANGLRTAQRATRITSGAATEFVERLGPLPIVTVLIDPATILVEVRRTAVQQSLSVYDASYLVLAQKLDVPLGTLDGTGKRMGLKQGAANLGIGMVDEDLAASWLAETP